MEKQIIIQGTTSGQFITITEGETPVINATNSDLIIYAASIANFLRCGCPSIQLVLFGERGKNETEIADLKILLKKLEAPNENFKVEERNSGSFLLITRKK